MPEIIEIITQDLPDVSLISQNSYIVDVTQTVIDINANVISNSYTVEILNPHINLLATENNFLIEITPPIINEITVSSGLSTNPYIKTLSGLSTVVSQSEHGLSTVRGVRVYDSITGETVIADETILNNNVTISSIIDLTNYNLIIY